MYIHSAVYIKDPLVVNKIVGWKQPPPGQNSIGKRLVNILKSESTNLLEEEEEDQQRRFSVIVNLT